MSAMGLMPAALQDAKHHDADKIADMQARRRTIEADVAGDGAFRGQRVAAPSSSET